MITIQKLKLTTLNIFLQILTFIFTVDWLIGCNINGLYGVFDLDTLTFQIILNTTLTAIYELEWLLLMVILHPYTLMIKYYSNIRNANIVINTISVMVAITIIYCSLSETIYYAEGSPFISLYHLVSSAISLDVPLYNTIYVIVDLTWESILLCTNQYLNVETIFVLIKRNLTSILIIIILAQLIVSIRNLK